jgi:hypothetical protein
VDCMIFLSMVDLLKLDCSGHKYLPDNIYHTFTCSLLTLLEFVCAMPMTFIIRYLGVTFHGNMFQLIQKDQKLTVLPDRKLPCIMTIS